MKLSPKVAAVIYFAMGILFTFMATKTAGETIWNVPTVLLMVFATFEFGVAIRLTIIHFKLKKKNDDKK